MPRFLSWIGRQRVGVHGERNLIDGILGSGGGEFAQRVLSNHAFTTANNRVGGQLIAERFYLGDNQGNNVDYAPADIHNINGSYPMTWFNNVAGNWVTGKPLRPVADWRSALESELWKRRQIFGEKNPPRRETGETPSEPPTPVKAASVKLGEMRAAVE